MDDISIMLLSLYSLTGNTGLDFTDIANKTEKLRAANETLEPLRSQINHLKETYKSFQCQLKENEEKMQTVVPDEIKERAKRIFEERLNSLLEQANTNFEQQIHDSREVESEVLKRLKEAQNIELEAIRTMKEKELKNE